MSVALPQLGPWTHMFSGITSIGKYLVSRVTELTYSVSAPVQAAQPLITMHHMDIRYQQVTTNSQEQH